MVNYEEFKEQMKDLDNFIERCITKEIDGEVHITIDDDNVNEFVEIINRLITIATNEDGYVDEIIEYLNELDKKITDKNMIAKFIPLFSAIHCFATSKTLPDPTNEIKIDDWVFELSDMNKPAPLDARIGKVVNIIPNEDGSGVIYRVKAPLANQVDEWEDVVFIVIPEMESMMKKYQEKYTKTF
jgi:hypothetical protein